MNSVQYSVEKAIHAQNNHYVILDPWPVGPKPILNGYYPCKSALPTLQPWRLTLESISPQLYLFLFPSAYEKGYPGYPGIPLSDLKPVGLWSHPEALRGLLKPSEAR